ncbi:MAG: hypothetical protein ACYC6T_15280 [Thermoleophilia bacterium]
MTARGKSLLATGLVLLTLGLVLGGIALALQLTGGTDAAGTDATTTGTTRTTGAPNGDSEPGTSVLTTNVTTPEQGATSTSGANGPSDTGSEGTSGTTSPTPPAAASPDDLEIRLTAAAAAAGFPVLGTPDGDWKLASVDSNTTANGRYVAITYERGSTYFSTNQEPSTPFPEVPNTAAVLIRGKQGDLLDLGHVVVIRWVEGETNMIFSTNLPSEDALARAESLQPIR